MPNSAPGPATPSAGGRRSPSTGFLRAATACLLLSSAACSAGHKPHATANGSPTTNDASPTTAAPTSLPPATEVACTEIAAIGQWPLPRRAAQLLVVPALDGQIVQLESVIVLGVGGVLLLGNRTPADLAAQIGAANRLAATRLLVMADEEGGGVQRLAGFVGTLPWARQMAATMTVGQVQAAAMTTAERMRSLGVNMDLAPVLDVDGGDGPNRLDADGLRSFSPDPAKAASYGTAFLDGLRQGGVIPVVKHFPGLGGATSNTDYGRAATPPLSVLQSVGLRPFQAAIADGAPAVMIANATVPGLTNLPASISPAAVQMLLRDQLGFHGLVLTDSLSAGAISAAGYNPTRAAVAAVQAGADMVLFGSTLTPAQTLLLSPANVTASTTQIINALVGAVQSGTLRSSRLDQAVLDVLSAKGVSLCPHH